MNDGGECESCGLGSSSENGKTCDNCNCGKDESCTKGICEKSCASGYYREDQNSKCIKCYYDKSVTDDDKKVCRTSTTTEFNPNGVVCKDFEPVDSGECNNCSPGKYSLNGKKCVNCTVKNCVKCEKNASTCEECNDNFILKENECVDDSSDNPDNPKDEDDKECVSDCSSCFSYSNCTSCKNGFNPTDGICPTCMQRYPGCKEGNCNEIACNECLSFFKKQDGISCDTNKADDIPFPKFELIGFGDFKKHDNENSEKSRVTFVLYLRLVSGMMFSGKVSFNLIVNTNEGGILKTYNITGTGIQDGTALGSYSDESLMEDCLVKFYCESDSEFNIGGTPTYQIDNLKLDEANGKDKHIDIPLAYDSLKNIDISKFDGNNIKKFYSAGKIYTFVQILQKTSSLLRNLHNKRILSDLTNCPKSGNQVTVNLDGIVNGTLGTKESLTKIFLLKTSDEKKANCTLKKEDRKPNAVLSCTIINPNTNFYITDGIGNETDNGEDKLTFIKAGNTLCQNYDTDTNTDNEISGNNKGSSSGGSLSGGAIAGIVIGGVAIIAIIGLVLVFIVKRSMAGNITSAVSTCSNTGINGASSSNEPVGKL